MADAQDTNVELFDKHSARYVDDVNAAISFTGLDADFFTNVKADYIVDICRAHFTDIGTLRVLDIGCGVGNGHRYLASKFSKLSGVDVSPSSVENAIARNPSVTYDVYEGLRLPYADESFDVVFTICVMHHVAPQQWSRFADEIFRVVKKGGLGLVFEHNPRNPLTLKAVNNCPFDADAVLLKAEETGNIFRSAGFSDVAIRYILTLPAGNRLLRKVDRLFASFPLGAQYYAQVIKP